MTRDMETRFVVSTMPVKGRVETVVFDEAAGGTYEYESRERAVEVTTVAERLDGDGHAIAAGALVAMFAAYSSDTERRVLAEATREVAKEAVVCRNTLHLADPDTGFHATLVHGGDVEDNEPDWFRPEVFYGAIDAAERAEDTDRYDPSDFDPELRRYW